MLNAVYFLKTVVRIYTPVSPETIAENGYCYQFFADGQDLFYANSGDGNLFHGNLTTGEETTDSNENTLLTYEPLSDEMALKIKQSYLKNISIRVQDT